MVETRGTMGYDFIVAAPAATGRDNPMSTGAAAPSCDTGAFFAPASLNGWRRWAAFRLAGPCARFVTPTSSATIVVTNDVADSAICTGVLS